MIKKLIIFSCLLLLIAVAAAAGGIVYGYNYYARDLPRIDTVEDYRMRAVSTVHAADGSIVAEFFSEQRYPVRLEEVPLYARDAFLAAEDASFYKHPGIDPVSIFRAFIKNIQTGSASQGGSTITQQVVKNILLSSEKKLDRKIKEAILAYRLEKKLSKDDILELYLNKIFFGNRAYGIKAAVRNYFHKDISEVTLAEAAMLAGLPQAPSAFSPVSNFKAAKTRQRYVLKQMVRAGFISQRVAKNAADEEIIVHRATNDRIFNAPYYVSEVRRQFEEHWKEFDIDADGLKISTALDTNAYEFAQYAVQKGLREVDKRQGWRGPMGQEASLDAFISSYGGRLPSELALEIVYPAYVTAVNPATKQVSIDVGNFTGNIDLKQAAWAKKKIEQDESVRWILPEKEITIGDVIEVSIEEQKQKDGSVRSEFILDQTPRLQAALVLVDPHTGKVPTLIGGYDYQTNQFNRATQGRRQPGSSFKPVIYLAAIDGFGYTPATIVYDEQRSFKVGEEFWTPRNYDKGYLGPITLRTALEKSRNLVSADIISKIGVDAAIQYARKLGFESDLGRNLSLSLGSSEVSPLEVTRAYGVFAAKGVLFPTALITRIEDRFGNLIYDFEQERLEKAEQTIPEASAFVMAHLMKGVVEHGTGYRVRVLERPVAGKTGTSNDQMDAWFVGYTPEWATGVWVGFDEKKAIGSQETGGRVAAPIWLYFMERFLKYRDTLKFNELVAGAKEEAARLGIDFVEPPEPRPLDFSIPEGVEPYWIGKQTGERAAAGDSGAFLEYFIDGTSPREAKVYQDTSNYWDLPDF